MQCQRNEKATTVQPLHAPKKRPELEARPLQDVDRKALRKAMNEKYKNTLAYLGR